MIASYKELVTRLRSFHDRLEPLRRLESLIELTRRGKPQPMPNYMLIEPSSACNYKCPKCPQTTGLGRPKTYFDVDLFKDLIGQLKFFKPVISLHHSGEGMLHPRIFDLIKITREAAITTILVTNASLLDRDDYRIAKEGPDIITFSVDGASEGVYEPAHGGASWEKIKSNIEEYFKRYDPAGPTRYVNITMVQNCQTQEQMEEYGRFTQRFPFRAVMIKPYFEWPDGKRITPIPQPLPHNWTYPCGHPWLGPAVLADGSVVPCCLDAHGLYPVGNVRDKSFLEIYRGEKIEKLRRHVMDIEGTEPLALCDSCSLKRLLVPFSRRGRILFRALPMWKRFFQNSGIPANT